jgi:hypothetical protein
VSDAIGVAVVALAGQIVAGVLTMWKLAQAAAETKKATTIAVQAVADNKEAVAGVAIALNSHLEEYKAQSEKQYSEMLEKGIQAAKAAASAEAQGAIAAMAKKLAVVEAQVEQVSIYAEAIKVIQAQNQKSIEDRDAIRQRQEEVIHAIKGLKDGQGELRAGQVAMGKPATVPLMDLNVTLPAADARLNEIRGETT